MNYGVRLLFRDKNAHNIACTDVDEARSYLGEIYVAMSQRVGAYKMLNKIDEIVYVCNTDLLIHAMIVIIEEKTEE